MTPETRRLNGIACCVAISFGVISLDPAQISAGHLPDSRIMIEAAEAYLTDARRSGRDIVAGPVPYEDNGAGEPPH